MAGHNPANGTHFARKSAERQATRVQVKSSGGTKVSIKRSTTSPGLAGSRKTGRRPQGFPKGAQGQAGFCESVLKTGHKRYLLKSDKWISVKATLTPTAKARSAAATKLGLALTRR